MTNLTNQRRLAAQIMKVGKNRVWIDPQRIEDVESAITREEVRKLVHEQIIKASAIQGVSRGRAKVIQSKKRRGRRKGPGRSHCRARIGQSCPRMFACLCYTSDSLAARQAAGRSGLRRRAEVRDDYRHAGLPRSQQRLRHPSIPGPLLPLLCGHLV